MELTLNSPVSRLFKAHQILSLVLLVSISSLSIASASTETNTTAPNQAASLDSANSNEPPTPSPETLQLLDTQLNNLFNDAVSSLKAYISSSSPFMLQEREARIERLEQMPSSNDFEQANKYRRLLETFRIELDYGKTIEAYQAELRIGDKERLVDFLRIGHLALYYQTFDGLETGIWSQSQANWQTLPDHYRSAIAKGLRIARKLEPPQLMELALFGMDQLEAPRIPKHEPLPENTAADIELAIAGLEDLHASIRENAINLKNFYQQQAPTKNSSAQIALLDHLIDSNRTPTLDELRQLLDNLLYRLHAQSRVTIFKAHVYAPNGVASEQEVLNAGGFSLIADGRYLNYSINDSRLIELTRQPSEDVLAQARNYPKTDSKSLTTLAIDPSGGQILQLLVQVPTFKERVDQGGAVGYLILCLGALALIVSLYRFVDLTLIEKHIKAQLQDTVFQPNNPLGRLLSRLEQSTLNDEEALYLIVEESLTTEQTRLEQGLAFLKLVAAIAPMLGLLGTVTGMIETFQSIALHGSGDPKLMSGGISEALVTTVAGLVTAIPILLLHSLLAGKSQSLAALLEANISVALAHRLEHRTSESSLATDA